MNQLIEIKNEIERLMLHEPQDVSPDDARYLALELINEIGPPDRYKDYTPDQVSAVLIRPFLVNKGLVTTMRVEGATRELINERILTALEPDSQLVLIMASQADLEALIQGLQDTRATRLPKEYDELLVIDLQGGLVRVRDAVFG